MVNFAILEAVQEFRCHFALPTNQAQILSFILSYSPAKDLMRTLIAADRCNL